jgi:transcriptional regulator with XRE-family HTH domain
VIFKGVGQYLWQISTKELLLQIASIFTVKSTRRTENIERLLLTCQILTSMKEGVYTVGEIIKSKRLKMGLLQSDVAVKLGIDAPLLSKIEKGLRKIKRKDVLKIATILKASEDELLTIWLADEIYSVVKDERLATEAINRTLKMIKQNTKAKKPKI